MRICFDARGLAGNLTGAGKAFTRLLGQLREDFPQHEYLLVAPREPARWRLPRQLLWEQVELPLRARRAGAHVLHAPGGTSAPMLGGRKVVMTVHDLAPTRHPEFLPHARSRWYWGRWVPLTARFADRVVVPSRATKRDLIALARIREDRIHVIPWGVALDLGAPPSAAELARVRAVYRLPSRYLLYVGTIDRRKDYATLLGALRHLDPTLQLVVAGTVIAGRTDFPELVARLDLRARVSVLGYVSERDLPALYRAADAFVYPSFYEGFGLPVLEALACGTPVVAYNTTSLPEVAGDAAILLDPPVTAEALAAAIARAVGDPATRADLVGRGLEQAKRFDWRITADLTMKVYESLAA
ncbi:MAG: glycosyltransferase family 1 protein [Candidatus Rokuibacteriota bacterium]|nr:MAG: glycosyltransferase family 1 protein [Candidatus Rokubacteria bacterium]PYN69970.1 MAG: glycosyltransferase family 1 protein [Candidatus Rokubacteria bacterium]